MGCKYEDCTGIQAIIIPNSVTRIGNYAFSNCSGTKYIDIANSISSIGNYSFEKCKDTEYIISRIEQPFPIDEYCFDGVKKNIPLYVPSGTKAKYQAAAGWKEFTNIIEMDETAGINSLTSDSSTKGEESSIIYSLDGRKVTNSGLSKGIYIKNGKKIVIK